jgi:hypothetical protein
MVVEIDALRFAAPAVPAEDEPPSIVDADWAKARECPAELLEVVAGRRPQVLSVVASSIIWSLRKSRLSISDGICGERASSTKKARSHASRKLTITRPPRRMNLCTTLRYNRQQIASWPPDREGGRYPAR